MKVFGLIACLSVLASCGGSSGGGSNETKHLSPETVDKFEQSILASKPGMVKSAKEVGTWYSINEDMSPRAYNNNELKKETILKIDGDLMYTLEETFEDGSLTASSREVKKESMMQLVKDASDTLPPGTQVNINGNIMTVKMKAKFENAYNDNGVNVEMKASTVINMRIDLNDIRCSGTQNSVTSSVVVINGKSSRLPDSNSSTVDSCSATLSATQLKALDLHSIKLCDETSGNDEEEVKCENAADLSYLVN